MSEQTPQVRPLSDDAGTPVRRPSRFPLVIAVLLVGIVVGWGLASLTRTSAATTGGELATGDADIGTGESATVTWTEATEVPRLPTGMDYAGATGPVEMGGRIYVVVRFEDSTTGTISNELWSSDDGLSWRSESIQLDAGAAVTDLTATTTGLILTGSIGDRFAMWRSLPGRAVDGGSFALVDVAVPDGITVLYEGTAVNEAGEVVTVVICDFPIWRDAIAPYLPGDIDPQDPGLSFFVDSVYSQDIQTPIAIFDTAPEVVVTRDAVWVRLAAPEDGQVLRTYDLPEGAFPVETTPDLGAVRVGFSWRSSNGVDFLPVPPGSALPDGYFLPLAWQDGFITAGYEEESSFAPSEYIRLWKSNSGRAWEPTVSQPPSECTRFEMATSSDLILLTGDNGTFCVGTPGGNWKVVAGTGPVTYAVGGPVGFVGYRHRYDYRAAMFSPDGVHWSEITLPSADTLVQLAPLTERLVALSRSQTAGSEQIHVWVGSIGR